jgi:hypothetical protein
METRDPELVALVERIILKRLKIFAAFDKSNPGSRL